MLIISIHQKITIYKYILSKNISQLKELLKSDKKKTLTWIIYLYRMSIFAKLQDSVNSESIEIFKSSTSLEDLSYQLRQINTKYKISCHSWNHKSYQKSGKMIKTPESNIKDTSSCQRQEVNWVAYWYEMVLSCCYSGWWFYRLFLESTGILQSLFQELSLIGTLLSLCFYKI